MAAKNSKFVWLLSLAGAGICLAQTDAGPATPPPRGGIAVSQASAFVFYSSQPLLSSYLSPVIKYGSLRGGGAAATLTWNHTGAGSSVSAGYTGSYFASSRAVDSTSFNHSLVFDVSRSLRRWTIGFSLNGHITGPEQFLFNPSGLGQFAATPSTADEFTSTLLTGTSTNDQLNGLVNRAPTLESPLRGLLYGERTAQAGASAYARYAVSPRLDIRLGVTAFKGMHLSSNPQSGSPAPAYLFPQSASASSSVGISYSLSPRTQLGGNLDFTRTFSSIVTAGYYTTGNVSLGHIMGRRWFLEGHAGAGTVFHVGNTVIIQRHRLSQPVLGGSTAYRTGSQTWMFVEDWTVGDLYGAGSTSTLTSTFTWSWSRPGSAWSLALGTGHQQLRLDGGNNLTGEGINARLGRAITRQIGLLAEYGFQTNYGRFSPHLRQQGVRLSLAWVHAR